MTQLMSIVLLALPFFACGQPATKKDKAALSAVYKQAITQQSKVGSKITAYLASGGLLILLLLGILFLSVGAIETIQAVLNWF